MMKDVNVPVRCKGMVYEQGIIQASITENGSYIIRNEKQVVNEIHICVAKHIQANIIVELTAQQIEVTQTLEVNAFANVHIVYKNECQKYVSREEVTIDEEANVEVGYFALHDADTQIEAHYHLNKPGAKAHIITTTLAKCRKQFQITCHHESGQTHSMIENYGICFENGSYDVQASGHIVKGAKGSKSHQSTRVLTLASKEMVKVTPLLLIDENDVEASHACSIGEMNEDHLYYLQTRGLNKQQALGLLTLSYVLPILQIVEEGSDIHTLMKKEIEDKVGLSC